jgi:hypothetical protein
VLAAVTSREDIDAQSTALSLSYPEEMPALHPLLTLTLRDAPIPPEYIRVVVDITARTTHRDFPNLAEAQSYAEDVRREGDAPAHTLVLRFDARLQRIG